MSEEDRIRSLIVELRMLEDGLNEINTRQSILIRAIAESRAGLETLKSLSKHGPSEVLIPIGGGLYIRSQAHPPEKLLVDVGGGVAVEKAKGEAELYVEERIRDMENAIAGLGAQRNSMIERLNRTKATLNSMIEKQQG